MSSTYLWSNQIANCKGQREYEKTDPITGKFCSFCFLHIHLQKVSRIFWSNTSSNHGCVRNHTQKSVCKALEYPGNRLIRQEGMRITVLVHCSEILPLQNLRVTVNDGWNDVLAVRADKLLMKLILGARRQNIEV